MRDMFSIVESFVLFCCSGKTVPQLDPAWLICTPGSVLSAAPYSSAQSSGQHFLLMMVAVLASPQASPSAASLSTHRAFRILARTTESKKTW